MTGQPDFWLVQLASPTGSETVGEPFYTTLGPWVEDIAERRPYPFEET